MPKGQAHWDPSSRLVSLNVILLACRDMFDILYLSILRSSFQLKGEDSEGRLQIGERPFAEAGKKLIMHRKGYMQQRAERLHRLTTMLSDALAKEKEWKPHCLASVTNTEIEVGSELRDQMVKWMFGLNAIFKMNPETVVLAATIMDNFLHAVKVRPKYQRCISVTCLFLASKIIEEDEVIPTPALLVEASECGCTAYDVLRMEKIILDKLQWNVRKVTALDFVHILHALLLYHQPWLLLSFRHMTVGRQLTMLTQKLLLCMVSSEVMLFSPSTQALALLSLELGLCTQNWLAITLMLRKLVQVDDRELIQCREAMSQVMSSSAGSSRSYLSYVCSEMVPSSPAKPAKRKVEQIEEVDDIYDSIKRLYGEDMAHENKLSSTCGSQATKDEDMRAHHGSMNLMSLPTVQPV